MKKFIFAIVTTVCLTFTSCEDVLREVIATAVEYAYYDSGYSNGYRWSSYYYYGEAEFGGDIYRYGDKYYVPTTAGFYISFMNTVNGLETKVIESLPYGSYRADCRPDFYDNYRRMELIMFGERLIFNLIGR